MASGPLGAIYGHSGQHFWNYRRTPGLNSPDWRVTLVDSHRGVAYYALRYSCACRDQRMPELVKTICRRL